MSAPHGITLGQLKALLGSMPEEWGDRLVVLCSDPEGNSFDTARVAVVGWYRDIDERAFHGRSPRDGDSWEDVERSATEDYLAADNEDEPDAVGHELDEYDHPAICLWP